MAILEFLSSSLSRRDQVPNIELAKKIASKNDAKAVKELVENLTNKKRIIQGDCIKVLYELGELKPELIAPYAKNFLALFDSKNNRMHWGAMTALDMITLENPKAIYESLPKLVKEK